MTGALKDVRHSVVAEVHAYWEGLREGRPVPLRASVDPRGIERALEYAFILERVAPSIARFRLAGMHLSDLMGMEVRGMPLTTFFAPDAREKVAEMLESVFQGPKVIEMTLAAETCIGKPALEAKLLLLPLKSDLGDISRALGCLVSDSQIGRTPRRFTVTSVKTTEITAGYPVDIDRTAGTTLPPATPTPVQAVAFAENQALFAPVKRNAAPVTYLRLVKSEG